MTLPASGPISFSQINTELGRSGNAAISLGDSLVRTLAGKSSGAISMSDLRGKSNAPVFSREPGTYNISSETTSAYFQITSDIPVTWTWNHTGNQYPTQTGGGTSTGIYFSISAGGPAGKLSSFTVAVTYNGITYNWTVTLQCVGNNNNGSN